MAQASLPSHRAEEPGRPGARVLGHLCESARAPVIRDHSPEGWTSQIQAWAGPFLLQPLSWACRCCLLPVSSPGGPSVSFCVHISSSKDTGYMGFGPTRGTSS